MNLASGNPSFDAAFAGPRPTLATRRLTIRPFAEVDAPDVERLAGDVRVAKSLLSMPHPYPAGAALEWIGRHDEYWSGRKEMPLAIVRRDRADTVAGVITLRFVLEHRHAELGYWIAYENWGDGIASEATDAMLRWGFSTLGLHRIFARHMAQNPASGAVMRRNSMRFEGTLREHHWKHGRPHDFHLYGILRSEFLPGQSGP